MGILGEDGAGGRGKLSEVEKKVTVSSMCRRRLGVVMTRLQMADTVQAVCCVSDIENRPRNNLSAQFHADKAPLGNQIH